MDLGLILGFSIDIGMFLSTVPSLVCSLPFTISRHLVLDFGFHYGSVLWNQDHPFCDKEEEGALLFLATTNDTLGVD